MTSHWKLFLQLSQNGETVKTHGNILRYTQSAVRSRCFRL